MLLELFQPVLLCEERPTGGAAVDFGKWVRAWQDDAKVEVSEEEEMRRLVYRRQHGRRRREEKGAHDVVVVTYSVLEQVVVRGEMCADKAEPSVN
jgi:hypothetical protein